MPILLAEDEPELATRLARALEQSGFQVDWVDDRRLVRRSLKATLYDARSSTWACRGLAATTCWPTCATPIGGCRR